MPRELAPHLPLIGGAALLLLLVIALSRSGFARGLIQLGIWGLLLWLLTTVIREHGRFDPALSRFSGLLDGDEQSVSGREVRVKLAADGHFWVRATIDGTPRRLLVDSGATITALSAETAAAAGLAVRRPLVPILLHTANGTVSAESARVSTLRFGTVTAHDLPVVVSPAFEGTDVLGMNFLTKLKSWRVENNVLILEPHHPQVRPRENAS